ncbi:protein E18C [Elephant endotheliotropic herpesvirus 3A]|uniref:Protein E18C n=1 Tax=Elephant endotheliotropic herpesvirus 3A TaxID=1329409 RepID=A0A866VSN4_9BETA|nr:protein E18C [Elephant endotheliotropic herpesvirus 3A]QOE74388.1 protein E18C [Elephant endotheliotropic herpesvirus 3A]
MVHIPRCELKNPCLTQYRRSRGYEKLRDRSLWTMWMEKRQDDARRRTKRRGLFANLYGPLRLLGRLMVAGGESRVVVWNEGHCVYTESSL